MNPPLDRTPHDPQRQRHAAQRARQQASADRRTERPAPRSRDLDRRVADGSRDRAAAVAVGPDAHLAPPPTGHRVDRRPLLVVGVAATLVCGVIALRGGSDDASAGAVAPAEVAASSVPTIDAAAQPAPAAGAATVVDPAATAVAVDPAAADPAAAAVATDGVQDLDGDDLTTADTCLMDKLSVRQGESGQSVTCLQQALTEQGFYTGQVTGVFDQATFAAVEAMQTERNLYVDGIVGRESAISLGIWPDEESFVTRTPPPPPGAVDLLGYPLSSVASAGADAPPLPENSGSGRRLVYDRAGQRVWAVGENGEIIRSWLVSGSKYSNELPGTHEVYSKSEVSTAWNGKAYLPKMVRWLKTQKGAIGFHSIPLHVEDESPYQTEAELGTRLSGGCQRQAVADANFVWDWADIGTKVVVI